MASISWSWSTLTLHHDRQPRATAARSAFSHLSSSLKHEPPTENSNIESPQSSSSIWTDEEFEAWIYTELVDEAGPTLFDKFGEEMFSRIAQCVTRWRQRYRRGDSAKLWKRLFKRDRVMKEIIESLPIVHAVDAFLNQTKEPITIVDLCSGKGYLSMLLSEYLSPEKVKKFVLIDKAWPMCFADPKPHHINWDHIYGNYTLMDGKRESYFHTWPIPLHTSKQNLKNKSTMRNLSKHLSSDDSIFILGIHLCGTLSLQAVNLFHSIDNAQGLILKPCCLPGMFHAKTQTNFQVGKYAFPTKEVCAPGFWKNKEWEGPPRWHLQKKFLYWSYHLHQSMKHQEKKTMIQTRIVQVPVQTNGGFQNTFLFAEKQPTTASMWEVIPKDESAIIIEQCGFR